MKIGTTEVTRLSAGGTLAREARLGTQQVYSIFKDPVSALFFRRQTAGGSVTSPALPQYGKALLSTIKGNSLVWNQKIPDGVKDKMQEVTTTDQTYISTGAVAGACFASHKYLFIARVTTLTASDCVWFWGGDRFVNNLGVLSNARRGWIMSPSSDKTDASFVVVANRGGSGTTGTAGYQDLQLYDLTLMYGAGNEPATVADFERDYPLKYYDYNPGQIIDLKGAFLETVGFNQWDEEWEGGILDDTTGEPIPYSNRWRTKNFIPYIPGTNYYFRNGGIGSLYVFEYDADQNFIKYTPVSNAALTMQAGTYFLKFYPAAGYGATYANDICVNISNATKNGTYEPYWKSTKNLGLDDIRVSSPNVWDEEWESGQISPTTGQNAVDATCIRSKNYIPVVAGLTYYIKAPTIAAFRFYDAYQNFIGATSADNKTYGNNTTFVVPSGAAFFRFVVVGTTYNYNICINLSSPSLNGKYFPRRVPGLGKAGSAYDEIDVARQKYVKRRARVNLGDLTDWFNTCVDGTASVANGRMCSTILASIIKRAANNQVANLTCSIYARSTANKTYVHNNDKIVACGAEGAIYIYDSAYISSTGAQFKTAMNGVYLDYELATPEEYDLETTMDAEYRMDYLGTEALIPENSSTPSTAKFIAEIKYPK